MTISEILDEPNLENGANYKADVLRKYYDNELLKRVFRMALDDVAYNYYIRITPEYAPSPDAELTLESALDFLEQELCTRKKTGSDAQVALQNLLSRLSSVDADILSRVIERNLKVGIQKKTANKVWKNLIIKPVYMRCGIFNEKTVSKIDISMKEHGNIRVKEPRERVVTEHYGHID